MDCCGLLLQRGFFTSSGFFVDYAEQRTEHVRVKGSRPAALTVDLACVYSVHWSFQRWHCMILRQVCCFFRCGEGQGLPPVCCIVVRAYYFAVCCHCVYMDRFTSEQRDTIKKTSSERLRARLEQAGWSSEIGRAHV